MCLGCGSRLVFVSDGFDRVAAFQLCTENDDPFDGLELRLVPGPGQVGEGQPQGCVRLRFELAGQTVEGLDLALSDDLPLVDGVRELRPSCQDDGVPAEGVLTLRSASGGGAIDGQRLEVDAELAFEDDSTLVLFAEELRILGQDCGENLED